MISSYQSRSKVYPGSRFCLQSVLVFLLLCTFRSEAQKQYRRFIRKEFGLELLHSSNGHGVQVAPCAGINISSHHFLLSALYDATHAELRGGRFSYSMNLSTRTHAFRENIFAASTPEPLQLNWFSYFQYNYQTRLSDKVIREDRRFTEEPASLWKSTRYNTSEGGTGIELRINFANTFCWRNSIAMCCYYNGNYRIGLAHEQSRLCVSVASAFIWTFL